MKPDYGCLVLPKQAASWITIIKCCVQTDVLSHSVLIQRGDTNEDFNVSSQIQMVGKRKYSNKILRLRCVFFYVPHMFSISSVGIANRYGLDGSGIE